MKNDELDNLDMSMMTPPELTPEQSAKFMKGYHDRKINGFWKFQRPKGQTRAKRMWVQPKSK